jgi:pimeloyl-ACP methyl ester carboxylesterase
MEKALEINGHPMTYVELGGPSARSLVLLNGWAQDHRLFKNVAPDLARDFHVLSPDWRGHDRGHTVHDDFGSSDLAYDLLIFLEAKTGGCQAGVFAEIRAAGSEIYICENGLRVLDALGAT